MEKTGSYNEKAYHSAVSMAEEGTRMNVNFFGIGIRERITLASALLAAGSAAVTAYWIATGKEHAPIGGLMTLGVLMAFFTLMNTAILLTRRRRG